jgi:Holliday junction resolvase RusA-like endonuclease
MTGGTSISLPFPPASLSGHNKGHWHAKSGIVAKHREWARLATMEANPAVPADGDIPISITFHAPDNRGDRTNYPNRVKPIFDGIADGLSVNDRRFLPSYHYGPNEKPGRVVVTIGGEA